MSVRPISTDDIPPTVRRDAIESAIVQYWGVGTRLVSKKPPSLTGVARVLPGARLFTGSSSAFECHNAPGDDYFLLQIGMGGLAQMECKSHRSEIRPGNLCFSPVDRPWSVAAPESLSLLTISLPLPLLERGGVDPGCFRNSQLSQSPAAALLQSYAATLLHEETELSSAEAGRFASHVQDLALLALGAERCDEMERARGRGARAALLSAIKTDIRANLRDPDLSLDWLAGRHRLSSRAIRGLFYREGTSFTDYVLAQRLDRVRDLLVDPAFNDRTITTLALKAGFGDLSWFYQAFRRRFGMSPTDMREAGMPSAPRD